MDNIDINILVQALDRDDIKFVRLCGTIIFAKVTLPDGRHAWTTPDVHDQLYAELAPYIEE